MKPETKDYFRRRAREAGDEIRDFAEFTGLSGRLTRPFRERWMLLVLALFVAEIGLLMPRGFALFGLAAVLTGATGMFLVGIGGFTAVMDGTIRMIDRLYPEARGARVLRLWARRMARRPGQRLWTPALRAGAWLKGRPGRAELVAVLGTALAGTGIGPDGFLPPLIVAGGVAAISLCSAGLLMGAFLGALAVEPVLGLLSRGWAGLLALADRLVGPVADAYVARKLSPPAAEPAAPTEPLYEETYDPDALDDWMIEPQGQRLPATRLFAPHWRLRHTRRGGVTGLDVFPAE
jgi:hypothetical protein